MVNKKKCSILPQLFLEKVSENRPQKHIAWIENDQLREFTSKEYWRRVRNITLALAHNGIKKGDKVALISQTRKEWHLFDLSLMCLGAIGVPIYPTYEGGELEYILTQSDSTFLIAENQFQLDKFLPMKGFQNIKGVFLIDHSEENNYSHYDQLVEFVPTGNINSDDAFLALIAQVQPQDVASIIYTSGTTGEPKGVVITHEAIMAMLDNIYSTLRSHIGRDDKSLVFLPMSHVLGRCDSFTGLRFDIQNIYAESADRVIHNLAVAKPTIMIAVPRVFEKISETIHKKVGKQGFIKKAVFDWACNISEAYFEKIDSDRSPNSSEMIQRSLAYKTVFSKIYEQFGGKVRFFVSGGAPLDPTVIKFLRFCHLTVLEGYGLTETIAPCTLNPVQKQIPGSVGLPLGDVKIKFDFDGEILIKSRAMFREYYNKPEETLNAFTEDGWFRTGDIGLLNPDGYLKITDRKKDLIITSAGKNISPQKIEGLMQTHPEIGHFVVVGEKRNYLTGLVTLHKPALGPESRRASLQELSSRPEVVKLIDELIHKTNQQLQHYEQIRKFSILPIDFNDEPDLFTPSLKVRRSRVIARYQDLVNAMYKSP